MKNQIVGIIYVISLLGFFLGLDRLTILKFQMEGHDMLQIELCVSIIFWLVSLILIKRNESSDQGKRNWKEKVKLVLDNTCSGSLLDMLIVLSFIGFAAWIPDTISDSLKEGGLFLRPFIYVSGLFFLIWGKPGSLADDRCVESDKRRLLLTGMSNIDVTKGGKANIIPVISPFDDSSVSYPNLQTIVVLLSDEILFNVEYLENKELAEDKNIEDYLKKYAKEVNGLGSGRLDERVDNGRVGIVKDKLRTLLSDCIYVKYGKRINDIIFSSPVDYNDFESCNNMCYQTLASVMKDKGYKDENVLVNITPGTKVVSSVMTFNAIKGNRGLLYYTQNVYKLKEDNINVNSKQGAELAAERNNK